VDRAGGEHERQAGREQRAHDRAHPGDADPPARLVRAHKRDQRELRLADALGRHEREPVAGGAEHEVKGRVGEQRLDERRRIRAEPSGVEALLRERQPAGQRAQLEGDGAGVDAGDAGAVQTISLATA
jgi:hypothetical protein